MRDNQVGIIHMTKQDRYLCEREAKQDFRIVGVGDRSPAGIRIRKSAVLQKSHRFKMTRMNSAFPRGACSRVDGEPRDTGGLLCSWNDAEHIAAQPFCPEPWLKDTRSPGRREKKQVLSWGLILVFPLSQWTELQYPPRSQRAGIPQSPL